MKYILTPEQKKRLENDYIYHPPVTEEVAERYIEIRAGFKALAEMIMQLTPQSREQSVALTHLDNAMMMSNAAIARNVK